MEENSDSVVNDGNHWSVSVLTTDTDMLEKIEDDNYTLNNDKIGSHRTVSGITARKNELKADWRLLHYSNIEKMQ